MNHLMLKKLAIFAFVMCGMLVSCNKSVQTETSNNAETQTTAEIKNVLGLNKDMNEKYPGEIKLFENVELTERLKNLIGTANYELLMKRWNVETPIKCDDTLFETSACQRNNCDATNFTVVYEISNDNLICRMCVDGKKEEFSERTKKD